jgi:diguanylate cyclase (GGDEF)-like protein
MMQQERTSNPTSLWGGPATARERGAAASVFAIASVATALVVRLGPGNGYVLAPFVPMAATLWTGADALTAFLLLALFCIDGSLYLALVASAYIVTGALSIPYLAEFPGVFHAASSPGSTQISAYIWSAWHVVFPLALAGATILDPQVRRRVAPRHRIRALLALLGGSLGLSAGVTALVEIAADRLPLLVVDGHFTSLFVGGIAPTLILCSLTGITAILIIARPLRPLHVWLVVALSVGALDSFLNSYSPGRYTTTWYLGKIETLLAANVVLAILLGEIVALFARSIKLSAIDVLTGLRNRRAFDEYVERAFSSARRRQSNLAVIVIDVDHFKQYNDRFGHAAGDVCLRRIATVLSAAAARSEDLAARYGGEEFVVILPATPLAGAQIVAEEIRSGIEALGIPHPDNVAGVVTVSLGVAFSSRGAGDAQSIFDLADQALYEAKDAGRNRVTVSNVEFVPMSPEQRRTA